DGIRDRNVTGVQTCALPILSSAPAAWHVVQLQLRRGLVHRVQEQRENQAWINFSASRVDEEYATCMAGLHASTRKSPGKHQLRSEEHTSELQSRFDIVCRLR